MKCCYNKCERPCIDAYTQQLCAIKSKLSQIESLQSELASASNSSSCCDCSCCCSMQNALLSLLKDIINKYVTEDEFEDYKKWIEAQGYLKSIPDYYLTEDELKEILKHLFGDGWNRELQRILDDYVKKADLPDYIRRWIEQNLSNYLSNYVTRPELNNYYTKTQVDSLFSNYYDKAAIDAMLRALESKIPSITDIPSIGDFNWVSDPAVDTANGRYKLGDLYMAGKKFAVYGKDNLGSGSNGSDGTNGNDGSSGGNGGSSTTITEVITRIENLQTEIDNLRESNDEYVDGRILTIISDYNWLKEHFPWGEIFKYSGWDEGMKAYLQTVGLIEEDGTSGTWSTLMQKYNQLLSTVTNLTQLVNEDGELTGIDEILDSYIEQYVREGLSGVNINTLVGWAGVDDENKFVATLKWLMSGFKTESSRQGTSFAQMYSDARNEDRSAVTSLVQTKADFNDLYASAELGARVTTYKLYRDSNGNPYISKDGTLNNLVVLTKDSSGNYPTFVWPALYVYLDKDGNRTLNYKQAAIDTDNSAGLITEANLDSAVATLFATNSNATAAIMTKVSDDEGLIELIASKVDVNADLTTFHGNVDIKTGTSDTAASGGLIYLGKDGNGYPILTATGKNEQYPSFKIYIDPNITSTSVYESSSQNRIGTTFCGDGSASLANGNVLIGKDGSISIKDTQINSADISTTTTQSIIVTANPSNDPTDPENREKWTNGGNTGIFLRIGSISARVIVDSNGFLKVDLDSITG